MSTTIRAGNSFPLGATPVHAGVHAQSVNFSMYAHHADTVELLLFDGAAAQPGDNAATRTVQPRSVVGLMRRPDAAGEA